MIEHLLASAQSTRALYGRQQYILRQGYPAGLVIALSEGVVLLSKVLPDGRRQIVDFALPGDLIGAGGSDTAAYSAVALTPAGGCVVPITEFVRITSEQLQAARELQSYTIRSLAFAQEHIAVLGRGLADEKVAWFLLRWGERWARSIGRSNVVHLPMTRQDIADYLGLTIETVSRTLTQFKNEGTLRPHSGHVEILDFDRLQKLASHLVDEIRGPTSVAHEVSQGP